MINLPPLDIKDGVKILQALAQLTDAVATIAAHVPDADAARIHRSLEIANSAILELLTSIDQKSR